MVKGKVTYYQVRTTIDMVKVVEGMSIEHMYKCRFELGMRYSKKRFPDEPIKLWNKKGFWNWFLRIWENNDRTIMDRMEVAGSTSITQSQYLGYQASFFDMFVPHILFKSNKIQV